MPVLVIEEVVLAGEGRAGSPGEYARAAAAVLGSEPGHTWIRRRSLPLEDYAENEGGPPPGVVPVFVEVLLADLPPASELAPMAERLASVLAAVCQRPAEHIHIVFQPAGRGRVAFGGRLVADG
ncbi:MAG TPA: hypothetical protein VGA52_11210 [Anaerolineales bacterium]|jgi:phenylpyruvate tautomerase PptA (4-oxalocrotonate tautomerase family)